MEHSKEAKLLFYIVGVGLVGFSFFLATFFLGKYFKTICTHMRSRGNVFTLLFFRSLMGVREGHCSSKNVEEACLAIGQKDRHEEISHGAWGLGQ